MADQQLLPRPEELGDGLPGEPPPVVIGSIFVLQELQDLGFRPRPERSLVVLVGILNVPPRLVLAAVEQHPRLAVDDMRLRQQLVHLQILPRRPTKFSSTAAYGDYDVCYSA